MNTIFRVHFSSTPVGTTDANGTNTFLEGKPGENVVDWKVLDTAAARAFVHSTELILNNNYEVPGISHKRFVSWNQYGDVNTDSSLKNSLCDELNSELDYCVQNNYINFDQSYYVNSDLQIEHLLQRLNAIHYAFEKDLENKQNQLTATQDYLDSLERLNKLVHQLEKTTGEWSSDSFYVIRHSADAVRHLFPVCTDEIYRCFENNTLNGDLFSDFFTVGKDLGHAFHTNDIELVRSGEVKQQSVISGSVAFACNQYHMGMPDDWDNDLAIQRFREWCTKNHVIDWGIDHTLPKYRLGRAPVARLQHHTYQSLLAVLTATPYVCDVELINE